MARTQNPANVEMIPAEFRTEYPAYLDEMPIWASAGWGFGVWGSIWGSVLILLRSRHAVTALVASLVGLAVNSLYSYVAADTNLAMLAGNSAKLFSAAILVILLVRTWYSLRQRVLGRLT